VPPVEVVPPVVSFAPLAPLALLPPVAVALPLPPLEVPPRLPVVPDEPPTEPSAPWPASAPVLPGVWPDGPVELPHATAEMAVASARIDAMVSVEERRGRVLGRGLEVPPDERVERVIVGVSGTAGTFL